jgi:hypothetical protein
MQHFLASRQMFDVPVRHLFVEYKDWIVKKHPFKSVREELATLAKQGDEFRRLIEPKKGDSLYPLAVFLNAFDISTAYPLLLFLLDAGVNESDWNKITSILESYFVRRAVCGLSSKNYRRIVLSLIRELDRDVPTASNVHRRLSELKGEYAEWPTDQAFARCWQTEKVYHSLNNPKMVYVMKRLNDAYLGPKNEHICIESNLTVEHIMPQEWIEHWPLPNGSKGLSSNYLADTKGGRGPRQISGTPQFEPSET